MNWLDILILVVGGIIALIGWKIGIIRVVVAVVGIAVGIVMASRLYSNLAEPLSTVIESEDGAKVAAFAIIFFAVMAVAMVVSYLIRKVLHILFMGWVDKVAGLALGVFIVFAIFSTLLSAVQTYPIFGLPETIQGSTLGSFLADKFDVLLRFLRLLPQEFGVR